MTVKAAPQHKLHRRALDYGVRRKRSLRAANSWPYVRVTRPTLRYCDADPVLINDGKTVR